MVIGASAIEAIALDEPESTAFEEQIADDPVRMISAVTLVETAASLTSGCIKPALRSSQSTPNWRTLRGGRGDVLASGAIPPALTSATVSPTRSPP